MKKYLDKKLFFILLGYVAAYKTVTVSRAAILKLIGEEGFIDISWHEIIFEQIIGTAITIPPIVIIILIVTKIMIDRNYKWSYIIGFHFIFSWVYGFLVSLSGELYFIFTEGGTFQLFSTNGILDIIYTSSRDFLGYVGFVSIIYSYYYIARSTKMELQRAQLSEQLMNIRMEALKSQLNPHFLFNTLNSISALIQEDQKKAQDMIANLGDLLREILILKDENLIPLHQEIKVLEKYIDIMMVRFSDHLDFNIKIEENCVNMLVPCMLIQPIIENSLKHGYSYGTTSLRVKLQIHEKDDKLIIHIENDGKSLDKNKLNNGTGLRNIKERLITLYNHDSEFLFNNVKGNKGVFTMIKIPIQEESNTPNTKIQSNQVSIS